MTIIGNNVTVGHNCIIHACTVEDSTLIGMGSVIMDYAIIKKHAIVAACSVVTRKKIINSNEVWIGQPAKPKRAISKEEKIYIQNSADKYVALSKEYQQSNNSK